MDRLHAVKVALAVGVALAAGGAAGCEHTGKDKKKEAEEVSGERVNAVEAPAEKQVSVEEFCDVHAASGQPARRLSLPPLAGGKSAPGKGSWRWINVWATWCKPCIEEMPRLVEWQKQLAGKGARFELVFLSVDDSDELVTRFRERHADMPMALSLRIADPDSLPKWMGEIGIGEGAPIPVHVFVDPDDGVRCVRAGGVKEKDLSAVRRILGAP